MKHYQHLNKEERFYIWNALRTSSSQADVAKVLNRIPSTIGREIKRNKHRSAKIYTYEWQFKFIGGASSVPHVENIES
jgi:IS30 family transposase